MKVSNCFERLRTTLDPNEHKRASLDYAQMVTGKDCSAEPISNYEDESFVSYVQQGLNPPLLPDGYELYKTIKEYWMQEADCYLGKSDKLPTPRGKDTDGQLQDNALKSAPEAKNEPVEPQQTPTEETKSDLPPLPPLPPKSEIIKKNRLDKLFKDMRVSDEPLSEEFWLDVSQPYQPQSFLYELDGIPCVRKGDFSCITGKFGNGKSQFISMMAAAALKGEYFTLKYLQNDEPKVLIIDTEQGLHDSKAEQCKIFDMCGFPVDEPISNFKMARLRSIFAPKDLLDYMGRAIKSFTPNIIIVDGLLDLVEDFNNITECRDLVRRFMELAEVMDIGLIAVLHQNPSGDKATGNLGSISLRKATDFLEVCRDNSANIYTVKSQKARGHKMIEGWNFRISDSSLWGRPEPILQADFSKSKKKDTTKATISKDSPKTDKKPCPKTPEEIQNALREIAKVIKQPCSATDIRKLLKKQLQLKDTNHVSDCYTIAINRTFIRELPKEKGQGNKKKFIIVI